MKGIKEEIIELRAYLTSFLLARTFRFILCYIFLNLFQHQCILKNNIIYVNFIIINNINNVSVIFNYISVCDCIFLLTIAVINNEQSFVCIYWTVQTPSSSELLSLIILLKLPSFADSVKWIGMFQILLAPLIRFTFSR